MVVGLKIDFKVEFLWGVFECSDIEVGLPWAKDVCRKKPLP